MEESNRMGKTRDLFKKIRDTKETFLAKMGTIKDRNNTDLREAENIKKRWQEYTEELFKKDRNDLYTHNGVITHLEPVVLECEVKWTLGSITMTKLSGGDRISSWAISSPKRWCCPQICTQVKKQQLEPDMEQQTGSKEQSEKASLKLNIQKAKIMASGPITSWQIDG